MRIASIRNGGGYSFALCYSLIMNTDKQIKNESTTDDTEEPIISRFSDNNTFAPRVIIKGDGKNPLDTVEG